MAGVTAKVSSADVTLTSRRKGEIGNLIGYRQKPNGITGATTVSVSGLDITANVKSADGVACGATAAEILAAISGSTDAQALVTATLFAGQTGTVTGVNFTGSGGGYVRASSGAESGSAVVYDTLGDATGAGDWQKQSGNDLDLMTRTRGQGSNYPGTEERQAAVSATGATAAVLAAGRTQSRLAAKGALGPEEY
jgi:hypothetical protein